MDKLSKLEKDLCRLMETSSNHQEIMETLLKVAKMHNEKLSSLDTDKQQKEKEGISGAVFYSTLAFQLAETEEEAKAAIDTMPSMSEESKEELLQEWVKS